MQDLGQLKTLPLRSVWSHEAADLTPWLAEHLELLDEVLGTDLELQDREAAVGNFSLDLLAKDLGTGRLVIIENQLTPTDHDHLGKVLTYAAGFDAGTIVWVAESFRDEHRQALDWLNQRTDSDTHFFGVVIELLQINDSLPAPNLRLVVSPNEWQKASRQSAQGTPSAKGEAYRQFFQRLIDDLREKHRFTSARIGQPQNWYTFASGVSGVAYSFSFAKGDRVRAELYLDRESAEENKRLFDLLLQKRSEIEQEFGGALEWERLDDRKASRVAAYRPGSIHVGEPELRAIHSWAIETLLRLKKVLGPRVSRAVKEAE